MSDKVKMNDCLCWGFLHQQHLKLGEMKPAEETLYCSMNHKKKKKKKSFPFTFVISKNNLYEMHYIWIVAGTLDFSGSALLQPSV